jgi:hypothetical protein
MRTTSRNSAAREISGSPEKRDRQSRSERAGGAPSIPHKDIVASKAGLCASNSLDVMSRLSRLYDDHSRHGDRLALMAVKPILLGMV